MQRRGRSTLPLHDNGPGANKISHVDALLDTHKSSICKIGARNVIILLMLLSAVSILALLIHQQQQQQQQLPHVTSKDSHQAETSTEANTPSDFDFNTIYTTIHDSIYTFVKSHTQIRSHDNTEPHTVSTTLSSNAATNPTTSSSSMSTWAGSSDRESSVCLMLTKLMFSDHSNACMQNHRFRFTPVQMLQLQPHEAVSSYCILAETSTRSQPHPKHHDPHVHQHRTRSYANPHVRQHSHTSDSAPTSMQGVSETDTSVSDTAEVSKQWHACGTHIWNELVHHSQHSKSTPSENDQVHRHQQQQQQQQQQSHTRTMQQCDDALQILSTIKRAIVHDTFWHFGPASHASDVLLDEFCAAAIHNVSYYHMNDVLHGTGRARIDDILATDAGDLDLHQRNQVPEIIAALQSLMYRTASVHDSNTASLRVQARALQGKLTCHWKHAQSLEFSAKYAIADFDNEIRSRVLHELHDSINSQYHVTTNTHHDIVVEIIQRIVHRANRNMEFVVSNAIAGQSVAKDARAMVLSTQWKTLARYVALKALHR
jgi:hypothetical protein